MSVFQYEWTIFKYNRNQFNKVSYGNKDISEINLEEDIYKILFKPVTDHSLPAFSIVNKPNMRILHKQIWSIPYEDMWDSNKDASIKRLIIYEKIEVVVVTLDKIKTVYCIDLNTKELKVNFLTWK